MKTDVIAISNSRADSIALALSQADKTAAYKELSPKGALHLRLLTEEMMGLMRSVTGEAEGTFWIEDEDGEYRLHLQVRTRMDPEKREKLLSASTSGRNESAKGLMGRFRDFFSRGMAPDGSLPASPLLLPGVYDSTSAGLEWEWSMTEYQAELSLLVQQEDPKAREIWDEMEKSVVTHVADDVKVSIRGPLVEMVILKKLA